MNKIDKLTPDQEQRMIDFREEWRAVGLATGPANIEAIRPVINDFYKRIGKQQPYLWRCQSPLQANLVINIMKSEIGANLRDNLRDNLGANLRANLLANLWDNLGDNLRANLLANLWDNLRANLLANLWDNLGANLLANLEFTNTYMWGSLDSYWIAYYLFPHAHLRPIHTDVQMQLLNGWATIARNCFCWYSYDGICFVCDRPDYIGMDDRWRMHNTTGPAVSFSDGWKLYAEHGVMLTEQIIMHPETITVKQIEEERNAEVRRVMMERYGLDRYLVDGKAKKIHQDNYGILWRKEIPGDEPLVMVQVENSTPEPDGSRHTYFLRVPPTMKTAHAAVAWTFEKDENSYQPILES